LSLLPPSTPPTADIEVFLELLARRLGMVKRGNIADLQRAAVWFVHWWREDGGAVYASTLEPTSIQRPQRAGWGFDLEWDVSPTDVSQGQSVQKKMEECIDEYTKNALQEQCEGGGISSTQEKKREHEEKVAKRMARTRARLAAKKGK